MRVNLRSSVQDEEIPDSLLRREDTIRGIYFEAGRPKAKPLLSRMVKPREAILGEREFDKPMKMFHRDSAGLQPQSDSIHLSSFR